MKPQVNTTDQEKSCTWRQNEQSVGQNDACCHTSRSFDIVHSRNPLRMSGKLECEITCQPSLGRYNTNQVTNKSQYRNNRTKD